MSETEQTVNPYEGFKFLRDHAPVTQLEEDGPWQVARHADVHAILRDHETYSSEVSIRPPEERGAPSMLFSDPPVHHRLRRLVSVAFKPSQIAKQEQQIRVRCGDLLDAIERNAEVDLVQALAAPLPVMVIAEMLGVEDGDMGTFLAWSDEIFSNIGEILWHPQPRVRAGCRGNERVFLSKLITSGGIPRSICWVSWWPRKLKTASWTMKNC